MTADPTVLIVDDERAIADAYAEGLSTEYDVRTAYSGAAAIDRLDSTVDVLFLDRRMPEVPGDAVLEEIEAREIDPRVVMVTAVEPDTDIIEMSFDEYLVKPVSTDRLLEVVERMLARQKQDEQLQRMLAVASKLATLETKLGYQQLEKSREYRRLTEEFARLRKGVDLPTDEEDPYLEATLEKVEALVGGR
ncbi:hypothetical protein BRC62_03150 [Halobacteriales archaeon QH_10_67_13]|nr:MAG: hypothetical protein BRC62_03150 [Halobacteriales archaeon QH_10_67_13]